LALSTKLRGYSSGAFACREQAKSAHGRLERAQKNTPAALCAPDINTNIKSNIGTERGFEVCLLMPSAAGSG